MINWLLALSPLHPLGLLPTFSHAKKRHICLNTLNKGRSSAFFFPATVTRRPRRFRALVCVRCPRTGNPSRCRRPAFILKTQEQVTGLQDFPSSWMTRTFCAFNWNRMSGLDEIPRIARLQAKKQPVKGNWRLIWQQTTNKRTTMQRTTIANDNEEVGLQGSSSLHL
jgi:hypothetical protein